MFASDILKKLQQLREDDVVPFQMTQDLGKVVEVVGTVIEAIMPAVPLGAKVRIFDKKESYFIYGEVVGFRRDRALIIPFSSPVGVCSNALVEIVEREQTIEVGEHLIGRVIDPYGQTLENKPLPENDNKKMVPLSSPPLNPLLRKRISTPFDLGVRSINGILTCGEGQRIGIMAGSGVGKSVLLGMIARYAQADLNVIALIGERGREVREFLDENLGQEGLARSIVVVSTGDQSPLSRIRAALVGTAIAEHFRSQNKRVLFMMDSLTRVAMAQREIGLAVGEPPTTKGYTPSVFSLLPRLLERVGNDDSQGSITGIYTVLVDGDDFSDPICDTARSILDGHINLSRDLAEQNHFPAIDILSSASRVMMDICEPRQLQAVQKFRELLAEYKRNYDLVQIGAYISGTNPRLDRALKLVDSMNAYLRQDRSETSPFEESINRLVDLVETIV